MLENQHCPVLGFAAFSGTGKTTLLSKILPVLKSKGIRVAVLKHAHHNFDIDHPGKDSHTLRHAGATQMLIASAKRWALMTETPDNDEAPDLNEMLSHLDQSQLDMILVEGFKGESFPKIELYRKSLGKPFLHANDKNIIAIATDEEIRSDSNLPRLDINDETKMIDFILQYLDINLQPMSLSNSN